MKVIVAGFSKTGTKTMNAALKALDYKVYDFLEHFWYAGEQWHTCMKTGEVNGLKEIYETVDAVVDVPANCYWEELLELFPDAKIILTIRDDELWLKSIEHQINVQNSNFIFSSIAMCPTGYALHRFLSCIGMVFAGSAPMWPWEGMKYYEKRARWSYRRHNANVMQRAPKDHLLVYNVQEGWDPLCKFLGVEHPNIPFPHKNKRGNIIEEMVDEHPLFRRIKKEMAVVAFGFSAAMVVGCYKAYPHAASFVKSLLQPR